MLSLPVLCAGYSAAAPVYPVCGGTAGRVCRAANRCTQECGGRECSTRYQLTCRPTRRQQCSRDWSNTCSPAQTNHRRPRQYISALNSTL